MNQVGTDRGNALARETRIVGIFRTFEKADRIPNVTLAPIERGLACAPGEARIRLKRQAAFVESPRTVSLEVILLIGKLI